MDKLFGINSGCIVEKSGDNPRAKIWHYRYINDPLTRHTQPFPTSVSEAEAKRDLRAAGITGIQLWPAFAKSEPDYLYGKCPICNFPGVARERRPNGMDTCLKGHTYLSSRAIIKSQISRDLQSIEVRSLQQE